MTGKIYEFPASKRELDRVTFETVATACAEIGAIQDRIRTMRRQIDAMEAENAPLRADAMTMLSRLATHLFELEIVIHTSRTTAAYCRSALKEMGQ